MSPYTHVCHLTMVKCNRCFFLVQVNLYRYIQLLCPQKGSLMKTQTQILDNRLYYPRKIELHRKGKKSRTVHITPIVICPSGSEISVLITVRRVHYSKMGKVPTTIVIVKFYDGLSKICLYYHDIYCKYQYVPCHVLLQWKSAPSLIQKIKFWMRLFTNAFGRGMNQYLLPLAMGT